MKNIPLLLGTIIGTVALIIVVAFVFSKPQAGTEAKVVDAAKLMEGATNITGKEDAAITVVEFSDFQCPSCKAAQPLVQQLKSEYADSVKVVYRHFPLDSIHPNARLAAQASEIAAAQGKFWEYHDILFAKQEEWADITDKKELLEKFGEYAAQLDIDKVSFLERIESQEAIAKVSAEAELGKSVDIQATPTFFVNGQETAAPQLISTVESLKSQSN